MRDLIAFVGFKSSGKNTAAEALRPYQYWALSFADALKDALAAIFCWNRFMLEGISEESRIWRETVDPWWAEKLGIPHFTPRWAMMNIGTEVMRQHFHYDLWVLNVEHRLLNLDKSVMLIDARFPNEIDLARRYGGLVVRIKRGPEPAWMELAMTANQNQSPIIRENARMLLEAKGVHSSEYAWIGGSIDMVIENDGTIDDLHRVVRQRLLVRPDANR